MASHKPVLGGGTVYPQAYDAGLLVSLPRAEGRCSPLFERSVYGENIFGVDVWTAYELSWLDIKGKPKVAIAEFVVDCSSAAIIESKSFKLYLNSLNQTVFASDMDLMAVLQQDLSAGFGGEVQVHLFSIDEYGGRGINTIDGFCLDELDIDGSVAEVDPVLLTLENKADNAIISEVLYSHLLKTNCPATGQPDWASIQISYRGKAINRAGLLAYLVSYRQHQDFHEHCVESIFQHILDRCQPQILTVYARYTRRGGLDINPYRSTVKGASANGGLSTLPTARQ